MTKPQNAILPAFHEEEQKLVPVSGAIADRVQILKTIIEHVSAEKDRFPKADHPSRTLHIPKEMQGIFQTPLEITPPRVRFYFFDAGLKVRDLNTELRQEINKRYGVKQVIKIGSKATEASPCLDRMEYPSKLDHFGINIKAVDEKPVRKWLQQNFEDVVLKPALAKISQRTKISYFPTDWPGVEIELGFDLINRAHTIFGQAWDSPLMEIELKKGPDDPALRSAIIAKECAYFTTHFAVKPHYLSNPAEAYQSFDEAMLTPDGQRIFAKLKPDEQWWNPQNPPSVAKIA